MAKRSVELEVRQEVAHREECRAMAGEFERPLLYGAQTITRENRSWLTVRCNDAECQGAGLVALDTLEAGLAVAFSDVEAERPHPEPPVQKLNDYELAERAARLRAEALEGEQVSAMPVVDGALLAIPDGEGAEGVGGPPVHELEEPEVPEGPVPAPETTPDDELV